MDSVDKVHLHPPRSPPQTPHNLHPHRVRNRLVEPRYNLRVKPRYQTRYLLDRATRLPKHNVLGGVAGQPRDPRCALLHVKRVITKSVKV